MNQATNIHQMIIHRHQKSKKYREIFSNQISQSPIRLKSFSVTLTLLLEHIALHRLYFPFVNEAQNIRAKFSLDYKQGPCSLQVQVENDQISLRPLHSRFAQYEMQSCFERRTENIKIRLCPGFFVQLKEFKTDSQFLQLSQNLTTDSLLIYVFF